MTDTPKNLTDQDSRADFIRKSQASPFIIAQELIKDNPDMVRSGENVYRNNGKCYDLLTDKNLEELLYDFCKYYGADKAWKSVSSVIRALLVSSDIKKVPIMNDYPEHLNLLNGVLNIHTKEFKSHPTDYYFDSMVNIDYLPENKDCPVFMEYLNNTFNGDKDTMGNIIRLGGYLLDTACRAERMFLFDGNGANGKSVLINTFSLFFSDDQITPLSLDKLASESFSKELLIKSRVNFCAEQKKSYLDSEEIKKIVTGDRIEIERKFKISLTFTPKTKLIVACNGLPKFNDTTHAIYRRMLLIRFHNQYVSQLEYNKISNPAKRGTFLKDPLLLEKIKLEKSAILNLFIEGLIDLRKNNYEFVESADSNAAMYEFKRDSDTVREFLEDNYEADEDGKMPLSHVYNNYKYWYSRNVSTGIMKFRINEMGKRLADVFGIKSLGQEFFFNGETQRSERQTVYPIREKTEPQEEHIATPEEKEAIQKELGITL